MKAEKTDRNLEMLFIANKIESMANRYIQNEPIVITYERLDMVSINEFTAWNRERFRLHTGLEAFFIWRENDLLYVVPVNADSYLTAAQELMDLIARKF